MELLHNLNIDLSALTVNIVGILILVWLMYKFLFKPVGILLVERQQDIAATYDKMEADRRQMEALRADYEQRLAGIEAEAREKIQGAIKDAQAARDQIVQEANARSKEMISRAEEEIQRERERSLITLREQVVDLAMSAATRIIGDSLDENRQRRLVSDFLASPEASGPVPVVTNQMQAQSNA